MRPYAPVMLYLIALALIPIFWKRPRAIFSFSSFMVLPKNKTAVLLRRFERGFAALLIASLALGAADIRFLDVKAEGVREGAQVCFVRDRSGSMYTAWSEVGEKELKIVIANRLIERFVRERSGDQYCLVDFGSAAVTKSTLTFDKEDFIEIVRMAPNDLSSTVIDQPIAQALKILPAGKSVNAKVIVLISDGAGRLHSIPEFVRLMRESQISFWFIFIGSDFEWSNTPVQELVQGLGSYGKKFKAEDPKQLADAMNQVRSMVRGLIHHPAEVREYPLDRIFYGSALVLISVLALFVLLELLIQPKGGRR